MSRKTASKLALRIQIFLGGEPLNPLSGLAPSALSSRPCLPPTFLQILDPSLIHNQRFRIERFHCAFCMHITYTSTHRLTPVIPNLPSFHFAWNVLTCTCIEGPQSIRLISALCLTYLRNLMPQNWYHWIWDNISFLLWEKLSGLSTSWFNAGWSLPDAGTTLAVAFRKKGHIPTFAHPCSPNWSSTVFCINWQIFFIIAILYFPPIFVGVIHPLKSLVHVILGSKESTHSNWVPNYWVSNN